MEVCFQIYLDDAVSCVRKEEKMEQIFKLDSSWENITEIIPFGYGRIGRRVIKKLKENFYISFIIDNNLEWQDKETEEIIKTFDQAKRYIKGKKIVVLTTELPYISIKALLEENGYIENKDFCILSRFLGEWYMKCKNQLCISKIDTIITSRCTLSCPHCAMYIPQCKNKMDYPLDELCGNFDIAFSAIDYVMEYSLFGGEPLIYKELSKLIEYLMSHYGHRIGRLVVISNGKAKLSEEVLNTFQKYHILVAISNYVYFNDYREIQNELIKQLDNKKIEYSFNDELVWKDMGYPDRPANISDQEARKHFKTCGHSTFCINNGILYFCDAMFGAEVNTGYKTRETDVIDIQKNIKLYGMEKTKMRMLRYIMGDINELGCPSFCQQCMGVGADNTDVIIAGS